MHGDEDKLIGKAKAAHTGKAKTSFTTSFSCPQEKCPSCNTAMQRQKGNTLN